VPRIATSALFDAASLPASRSTTPMKRSLTVALLAAAFLIMTGCRTSGPAGPVVDPASHRVAPAGPVVGFQGQYGSHVWRGIPYAQPPVGPLRWGAPQPAESWTDTRVALAPGSPCTQYTSPFGGVAGKDGTVVGSENCLYLNIYAPQVAEDAVPSGDARWPVMVWIHGGGNSVGEAGFYDGGHLAAAEHVVVVTLNYRLGPFGWFRHAALRADAGDAEERSGNFAILDIVRGLAWVRDNIGAFGGNPDNVTVFGESAGGQNVFTLLLAPAAKGLFHRAIVESGGLWSNSPAEAENFADAADPGDPNSSNEVLIRLLIRDRTAANRDAAKAQLAAMHADEIAAYLRGKSSADLMGVYTPAPGLGMLDLPKAFRDGSVLPANDPLQHLARADGHNRVPVMLGTNHDENKLFMFADPQWVRRYFWIVPRLRDERMYTITAEYLADMWKAIGADTPADALREAQPKVFVYRFDWHAEPTLLGSDLGSMLGAAHGFEIPFVFGHFDLGKQGNVIFSKANDADRQVLAKTMMAYWAEFARTGSPGRGGDGSLTEWTAWDTNPGAPKYMILDSDAGGGIRMSPASLTTKSVLAALDADPRLAAPRDKCAVLHDLARWGRGFSKHDYAARPECAPYPYDTYPWVS
jgi:para-nitrobenzyl esterase